MTLVGCVQKESDYRSAKSAGAGGAAGTGVGTANEFVLVDASPASSASAGSTGATGTAGAATTSPGSVGTSGAAAQAFELTGPGEGQLSQYVGKRVEIIGKMKDSSAAARSSSATAGAGTSATGTAGATTGSTTGSATGSTTGAATGSTAGAAGGQVDPMGQDLNLKEFEVSSVREASGSCPEIKQ